MPGCFAVNLVKVAGDTDP